MIPEGLWANKNWRRIFCLHLYVVAWLQRGALHLHEVVVSFFPFIQSMADWAVRLTLGELDGNTSSLLYSVKTHFVADCGLPAQGVLAVHKLLQKQQLANILHQGTKFALCWRMEDNLSGRRGVLSFCVPQSEEHEIAFLYFPLPGVLSFCRFRGNVFSEKCVH